MAMFQISFLFKKWWFSFRVITSTVFCFPVLFITSTFFSCPPYFIPHVLTFPRFCISSSYLFFFFLFFFYLFKFSLKSVQIFLPEFTASEYFVFFFFFVLILFTASFLPSPLLCKYPADIIFICSLRSRCTLHFTCLNPHPGHICISWWEKPEYTQFSLTLHSTPCLSFHKNETKFPGQKDTSQLYLISGHTKGIARCMAVSSCTSILSVSKYFLTVPEQCCIS